MDHNLLLALAAMATAIGGFVIGVLNFRLSARKSLVDNLQEEVERLRTELKEQRAQHQDELVVRDAKYHDELVARDAKLNRFRRRLKFQSQMLLKSESNSNRIEAQNKNLLRKIDRFYAWGDQMGRKYNEMELTLGALVAQSHPPTETAVTHGTAPLPPLPEMPARDDNAGAR
jgi:uncharacterized membrane-anchored protein YhcB (DUF1043 family)